MDNRGGAREGAGRQKGKPNKDKRELIDMIQEKYPDYHPLLALAEIANTSKDKNLKLQASKEVCKYIVPQLKSIDHIVDLKADIIIDYPTEED